MIKRNNNREGNSRLHFEVSKRDQLKCKRSQEEIVGFMIIILLVVIVGVIFLGIYLRKPSVIEQKDAEIGNFLSSSLRYTTECYSGYAPPFRDLGDLSVDCFNKDSRITCPDSQDSCSVLNNTYSWMLKKLWPAGKDRPIKYARLTFSYVLNASSQATRPFLSISQGNNSGCMVQKAGTSKINIDPGNVVLKLEICTGN